MKKKMIALLLGACMATLTACGGAKDSLQTSEEAVDPAQSGGSSESTESGAAEVVRTQLPAVASVDMDINLSKQVTKLCDYTNIPLTITGNYEINEEEMQNIIQSDLVACYANLVEVTDRDVIGEDDIARVDYTGYRDGEAFEGGSAEGAYVKMGDGNGYIDGFTKDLVGAKVGDELDTTVTFPEDYSSTELAGQEAVFHFKVLGIYKQIDDYDELKKMAEDENSLVNTNVAATFGAYGISDFDSLVEYETNYVKNTLEKNKYNDTVTALKNYMVENCEVKVPEDYLNVRTTEYQISFENENLTGSQSLEDFLKENYNGISVDEAYESWKEYEEKQIAQEFIFGLIAEKEKIELDETEFDSFVTSIVSSSGSSGVTFESADELYQYYGAGNADNGKKYMKQLFLMNKAIDKVCESAKVTIEEPEDTESEE